MFNEIKCSPPRKPYKTQACNLLLNQKDFVIPSTSFRGE